MTDLSASSSRARRPVTQRVVGLVGGRRPTPNGGVDSGLGQGMEMALTLAVFLGLGWLLDAWLSTQPGFMIGLVVFAALGQGTKMWFTYDARMKQFEADRKAAAGAHQAGPQASDQQERNG
ncbi:MAG: hypothetical protein ACKOJC_06280 [Actinomycetota bacterium]